MRTLSFNKTRIRHGRQFPPTGCAAVIYKKVMEAERAALYCTPERVAEIERRQPEALESGRALFYRPGTVTGTVKGTRRGSPVVEEVETPSWRKKPYSYPGREDELCSSSGLTLMPIFGFR